MKSRWLLFGIVLALMLGVKTALYGFEIKDGVTGELQPVMDSALTAVKQVWAARRLGTPVITSIMDGQHQAGSLHYLGLAFDVRLNNIPAEQHESIREEVAALAGTAFDVVHEYHLQPADHLHVEFDPT